MKKPLIGGVLAAIVFLGIFGLTRKADSAEFESGPDLYQVVLEMKARKAQERLNKMISVPTYNQADPKWKDKSLTTYSTGMTLGSHGCFVTSLTMLLAAFQIKLTPDQALERLHDVNGITYGGLLTYDGVERAFPGVHFYGRYYTELDPGHSHVEITVDRAVDNIRKLLDRGQPVILAVDLVGDDGWPDHAVLAYGYVLDGDEVVDFRIKDPGTGKVGLFSDLYTDIRDGIYGYVSIVGPPTMFPEGSKHKGSGIGLWKALEVDKAVSTKDYEKARTYARELADSLMV